MKSWEEMTDAEKDDANEMAWAMAADRLRRMLDRNPAFDLAEARAAVNAEIEADYAEEHRVIRLARRTRATKMQKRFAVSAAERAQDLALVQGFIWDVEV